MQLKGAAERGNKRKRWPCFSVLPDVVEAPVKTVAVFLSGVAIALAGAFTRSCDSAVMGFPGDGWCGPLPGAGLSFEAHCAGCALMAAGGIAVVIAAAVAGARMLDKSPVSPASAS